MGGAALFVSACATEQTETEIETVGPTTTPLRFLTSIGVQLYTLHNMMEEDLVGTIRQVAGVGYKELEFAGLFGHDPAAVRALIDELGLTAPSAHIPIESLKADLAGEIETAKILGHQYIVCPWLSEHQRSIAQYREHAQFFNEVGMACKESDIQFAYHNHEFEFVETDGVVPYDLLLAETDPELMKMELDLYWIKVAEEDPLRYFAEHPGRFPLCHVKDMANDGSITTVGEGNIDFAPIFAETEQAGLLHYFVEHDWPDDPMGTVTRGFDHVSNLTF